MCSIFDEDGNIVTNGIYSANDWTKHKRGKNVLADVKADKIIEITNMSSNHFDELFMIIKDKSSPTDAFMAFIGDDTLLELQKHSREYKEKLLNEVYKAASKEEVCAIIYNEKDDVQATLPSTPTI